MSEAESRRLVALEVEVQVAAWLPQRRSDATSLIVALSAKVDDLLDQNGVAHRSVEDFYSEQDLMKSAAGNNVIVWELCADIDRLLGVHITDRLPDFSAYYHGGRLRVLRDSFQRAAFCLGAMLDQVKPATVVLGSAEQPDPSEIWIRSPAFLTYALAALCRQRGIPVEQSPAALTVVSPKVSFAKSVTDLGRQIRDHIRCWFPPAGDIAYFFWPERADVALAQSGLTAVRLPAAPAQVALKVHAGALQSLERHFVFGRDNLFALAAPHIQALMENFRARSLVQLRRTERVMARAKSKAAVATAPLTLEAVNSLVAARRAGLPAIVLQHGGFNGYADFAMLPFTDFAVNDHYLCYGPAVAENLATLARQETPIRDCPVISIPTGSPSIDAIYKSRSALPRQVGRPRVIYAPTYLAGSSRYLAGHHRPDIAYWRLQRSVLKLLLGRSDWDVHFRPAPINFVANPILPWLERQADQRIAVRTDKAFGTLLQSERFDLIVTDSVTTTLLEALATEAGVVTQFDGNVMRLRPEAEPLLRKRASVAFDDEAFLANLEDALARPADGAPVDDSFLLQYALTAADGEPSVAQVKALKRIIGEVSQNRRAV